MAGLSCQRSGTATCRLPPSSDISLASSASPKRPSRAVWPVSLPSASRPIRRPFWSGAVSSELLVLVLVLVLGLAGFRKRDWIGWALAACGGLAMQSDTLALRETSVAHVAVIYAAAPFFAAALGWIFLKEGPSRSATIASLLAFLGAVNMVGLGQEAALHGDAIATVSVIE
jgi:drug/metabolite transporter (DMT)-like permease